MAQRRSSNKSKTNKGDTSGKTSAQRRPDADVNEGPRAAQALRLRRLGYTYDDIAALTGYKDESGARKAIKRANARIIRDEARELIGWQLDQLDMALNVVLKRIQRNDSESLWAVDRLVPLLKRQSELMGLDAPKADANAGQQMMLVAVAADVLEAV